MPVRSFAIQRFALRVGVAELCIDHNARLEGCIIEELHRSENRDTASQEYLENLLEFTILCSLSNHSLEHQETIDNFNKQKYDQCNFLLLLLTIYRHSIVVKRIYRFTTV